MPVTALPSGNCAAVPTLGVAHLAVKHGVVAHKAGHKPVGGFDRLVTTSIC